MIQFRLILAVVTVMVGCVWDSGAVARAVEIPYEKSAAAELFSEADFTRFMGELESREPGKLPYWRVTKQAAAFLRHVRQAESLEAFLRDAPLPDPKSNPLGSIIHGFIRHHLGKTDPFPPLRHLEDANWAANLPRWVRSDELRSEARGYTVGLFARSSVAMLARGPRSTDAPAPDGSVIDPLKAFVGMLTRTLQDRDDSSSFCTLVLLREILATRHDLSRLFWDRETIRIASDRYPSQLPWMASGKASLAYDPIIYAVETKAQDDNAATQAAYLYQEVLTSALDLTMLHAFSDKPREAADEEETRNILRECARLLGDAWPPAPSVPTPSTHDSSPKTNAPERADKEERKFDADTLLSHINEHGGSNYGCYPTKIGEVELRISLAPWDDGRRLLFMGNVLMRMPGEPDSSRLAASFIFDQLAAAVGQRSGEKQQQELLIAPRHSAQDLVKAGVAIYPDALVIPDAALVKAPSVRYVLIAKNVPIHDIKIDGSIVQAVAATPLGDALLCRIVLASPEKDTAINLIDKTTSASIANIPVHVLNK